jgi:hypothetical protein
MAQPLVDQNLSTSKHHERRIMGQRVFKEARVPSLQYGLDHLATVVSICVTDMSPVLD